MKPDFNRIRKMLRIGIPTGIENSGFELGKLVVASVLSRESTIALAANALEITFEAFSSQFGGGACTAIMIIVGTCVGAGRNHEAKQQVRRMFWISKAGTVVICLLAILIARPIAVMSGLGPEATELFVKMNLFVHISKMISYECFLFSSSLRGAGDVRFTMISSLAVMWGVRVALSVGLELLFGLGVMSMWIGMVSDWVVRFFVFGGRFLSGKWIGKDVIKSGKG